jgi:hypothetical protein
MMQSHELVALGPSVSTQIPDESGPSLAKAVVVAEGGVGLTHAAQVTSVAVSDTLSLQVHGTRDARFVTQTLSGMTSTPAPSTRTDMILAAAVGMQRVNFRYVKFDLFKQPDEKTNTPAHTLASSIVNLYAGATGQHGAPNGRRAANGSAMASMARTLATAIVDNTAPTKASQVWDVVAYNTAAWAVADSVNATVGAGTAMLAALPAEFRVEEHQENLNKLCDVSAAVIAGTELLLELKPGEEDLADTLRLLLLGNANVWHCTAQDSNGNALDFFNNMSAPPLLPVHLITITGNQAPNAVANSYLMAGVGNAGGYGIAPMVQNGPVFALPPGGIQPPRMSLSLLQRAYAVIARAIHDKQGLNAAMLIRSGLFAAIPATQASAGGNANNCYASAIHKRNAFVTGIISRPSGSLARSLAQSVRLSAVLSQEWMTTIQSITTYWCSIASSAVGCLMTNRMFGQARREMGATGEVLCPTSPNTQAVGIAAVGDSMRIAGHRSICAAYPENGVPSPLMACMRLAALTLFGVSVEPEIAYITPGDFSNTAYDKMEQAQLFVGRIPPGMSLYVMPAGIVKLGGIGLAGVYVSPNDTIRQLARAHGMRQQGRSVITQGSSQSTIAADVTDQHDMIGGPGMLGHGAALLRLQGINLVNQSIASASAGGHFGLSAPLSLATMQSMYSARTAVTATTPMNANSEPFLCADEMFADVDPVRSADLQLAADQPDAHTIISAVRSDFARIGTRFTEVSVHRFMLSMQNHAHGANRRRTVAMAQATDQAPAPAPAAQVARAGAASSSAGE